ncbi:uncharacterized protein UV8b_00810 [Ustilaginoidea virens]|uniref:Xylanolytic transcriptional activator regulatory domain-containing protein n=1 Tax=Ustilaginoidea virens TaxID=1159556 RepID=A0A8E5HJJ2_USTVR|nr:uncharacterized protein UV8b_00810 [Ustilaginoidea virens]QUC16569.1 hypothetical protein UV8b_00810 [Ustilaginoidea virens]
MSTKKSQAKRGPKSRKKPDAPVPPESVSTFPGRRSILHPIHLPFAASSSSSSNSITTVTTTTTTANSSTAATFASPSNSSPSSWDTPAQFASVRGFTVPSPPPGGQTFTAIGRWRDLSRAFALQNKVVEQVVEQCFGLFFQYLYPLTPLVHEPSLRHAFSLFASQSSSTPRSGMDRVADTSLPAPSPRPSPRPPPSPWAATSSGATSASATEALACWNDATFTLITAVCAEAAFLLPKNLFPQGEAVADLFLQASRDCLSSYLEADLESPNANSITIRYFHSNCVHAAGKPKYSWHIFGEATRLTQVMRLHDEASLEGLPPIEAELRRRAFWIVYMGDKSAAILNNRPITMHKYCFDTGITTAYPTGIEDPSVSVGNANTMSSPGDSHARRFIAGFNANLKMWQAASDLLIQVRVFQDQKSGELNPADPPNQVLTEPERQRLDSLFVHFITSMDDLPPFLQAHTFPATTDGRASTTEANQFVIQCANLQVSFHCLHMVIIQKFEDIAFFAPGAEQADLRKTEIVRDMLRVMHEAPFWSLQVNGEPYVEKIRLIGATLLSIIHRNQASPLAARARGDFSVLLDVLTRLDSKASDALKNTSRWAM